MKPSPALIVAGLVLAQRLLVGFWPCDDAFIAYRFAHNLAEYGQLAFNRNDPVFGCTTLSYALILSALTTLGMSIPIASWGVTLLADMAVCALLVHLSQRWYGRAWPGLAAVFLWLAHPVIGLNAVSGME